MHFAAITNILHDDALMAQLYAYCNIGELFITVLLFAIASYTQRISKDIYQGLIDLHFNRISEAEAEEAIYGKSTKQAWLEYAELACFILLLVSQVFTTWYILQP